MDHEITNWSSSIQKVVIAFQNHLKSKYDLNYQKSYENLLLNNIEAAISEAVVFNWLCESGLNPQIEEDKSSGGADFICYHKEEYPFIVEVTCLGRTELAKATGCDISPGQLTAYKLPTEVVRRRVSDKAGQLANYKMPRVLVITSLHEVGSILLGTRQAENFLISDWAWTIPVGSSSDEEIYLSTNLKESIFFRFSKNNSGKIEFCRQSISAVLLCPISVDNLKITGILHPKPIYPLAIEVFPKIPFLRIKNDFIQEREIFTEWVVHKPNSAVASLYPCIK